jgi:hypothetical protein
MLTESESAIATQAQKRYEDDVLQEQLAKGIGSLSVSISAGHRSVNGGVPNSARCVP